MYSTESCVAGSDHTLDIINRYARGEIWALVVSREYHLLVIYVRIHTVTDSCNSHGSNHIFDFGSHRSPFVKNVQKSSACFLLLCRRIYHPVAVVSNENDMQSSRKTEKGWPLS